jgi:alanine-glyoxylate transaminase / serine-glyoxylate transaminase / serine-pyruvate transaminase
MCALKGCRVLGTTSSAHPQQALQVNGKVFRIGHLGNMDEVMNLSAIAGAEMALLDAGVKITPGAGVGAAIKYLQGTSSVIPTRESVLA